MSSPDDNKSAIDKKSLNKLPAAKGSVKPNIVAVKKRSSSGSIPGTFSVIKNTLLSQAAEEKKKEDSSGLIKSSGIFSTTTGGTSNTSTNTSAAPSQDNFLRPPQLNNQQSGRASPSKPLYDLLNFNADTSEAQELLSKKYVTAEERYRALEARDKILRASE